MNPRPTVWGTYARIAETLRQRITRGDIARGSLLPSEAALCEEFAVARNTARRAFALLEAEGLIETLAGQGRVVRHPNRDSIPTEFGINCVIVRYRSIADDLRAQIRRGDLVFGDRLPSEAAITAQYGVSRGTARHALADLERAGLVEAVHGKGRFVRRRP